MTTCSIIIPTYNRLRLLKQSVASVLAQTYSDWHLIIIDDGSTDGTLDWALLLESTDSRIRLLRRSVLRKSDRGAQVCRNLGINSAQGEFILFLDSDDLLAENCLEKRIELLRSNVSVDAVVCQALRFSSNPGDLGSGNIWGTWKNSSSDLVRFLSNDIPWQTSGPLWRKSSLAKVGFWDESLKYVGHDHEYHVRALCRGVQFLKLPIIDYFWRVPREDSLSSQESFKKHHRDGGMINAYSAIVAEVISSQNMTADLRILIITETLRLAIICRNLGGTPSVAEAGLLQAYELSIISSFECIVSRFLLRCWWRILGYIPAMSLLSRFSDRYAGCV